MLKRIIKTDPKTVFSEYRSGTDYKAGIGKKGIFEQSKINERFYVGDQWYGAKCGNNRPLVRRNIIKRIGEYKMATITASPVTVHYSADGVPNTTEMEEEIATVKKGMAAGLQPPGEPRAAEISVITEAMSEYFAVTAERVKFDNKKEELLRNAYISGTGIAYTYWDADIETGLYVDEGHTAPIKGDIALEIIDVENIVFGDPNNDDVQSQPFIIISQRLDVDTVRHEAERNGIKAEDIELIKPDGADSMYLNSGTRGEQEPTESRRVTVMTKFYKKWTKDGKCEVYATRVAEKVYIRREWSLNISRYPFASFCWERRRSSAYGDSEITYMVPNQIAINRAITSAVWELMSDGMPIMLVNNSIVPEAISNEPGQIIRVEGDNDAIHSAAKYLSPPAAAGQYIQVVNDLSSNTLTDAGANDAALGNMRPDNAAAIIQIREAAIAPMQLYMNRFYDFIEDVARIWSEMWLKCYGKRSLKICDRQGTWYMPFNPERYRHLSIVAKIDVGASTLWSEAVVTGTLDRLLTAQIITPLQYLERLPNGLIPDLTGLINDIKAAQQQAPSTGTGDAVLQQLQQQYPELYAKLQQMSPEQQQSVLAQLGGMAQPQQAQTVGDM